jgi:hypothetical protein
LPDRADTVNLDDTGITIDDILARIQDAKPEMHHARTAGRGIQTARYDKTDYEDISSCRIAGDVRIVRTPV